MLLLVMMVADHWSIVSLGLYFVHILLISNKENILYYGSKGGYTGDVDGP